MKSGLLIVTIVATIVVVAIASYFVITNQSSPTTALMNARALLAKNVTTTYQLELVPIVPIMGNGIIGNLPRTMKIGGLITISRTPIMDATVINGTVTLNTAMTTLTAKIDVALWRYDNELCYALELGFMGAQSITHCEPYANLTSEYVEILNESRYIGTGNWNGKTTYCFTATITLSPTSIQNSFFATPIIVNVTKLCLLGNGIPANATIYIYTNRQTPFGRFKIGINMTLVKYEFAFNQAEFSAVTKGLIPG